MPRRLARPLALAALLGAAACAPTTIVAVGAVDAAAEPGAPAPRDAGTSRDTGKEGGELPDALAPEPEVDVRPEEPPPPLPEPGLVGRWSLDEGAGTRVFDHSGSANHGQLERGDPATFWVPGRMGAALNLSEGLWVNVPSSPSIDSVSATNALTIAAWVWPASFSPGEFNFIVSRQIGATPLDNYGLALRDGRPTLAIVTDFISSAPRIEPKRWSHLAVTFDGLFARVYVDGLLVAQQRNGRRLSSQARPLLIGGNQNDGSGKPKEFFDGFVDEVRLYNRALLAPEVADLAR